MAHTGAIQSKCKTEITINPSLSHKIKIIIPIMEKMITKAHRIRSKINFVIGTMNINAPIAIQAMASNTKNIIIFMRSPPQISSLNIISMIAMMNIRNISPSPIFPQITLAFGNKHAHVNATISKNPIMPISAQSDLNMLSLLRTNAQISAAGSEPLRTEKQKCPTP